MSVALGAVYTRPWTFDLILDLAGYCPETDLVSSVAVEPVAGDGAFLIPMVERLVMSCHHQGRPLMECAGSLVACELDEIAAHKLQENVVAKVVGLGTSKMAALRLAGGWVKATEIEMHDVPNFQSEVIAYPAMQDGSTSAPVGPSPAGSR